MLRGIAIVVGALLALLVLVAWALYPDKPDRLPTRGQIVEGRIEVDGLQRRYEAYVPPDLPPGSPLMFMFHGSGMDPASMRDAVGWRFAWLADREGFAIVYPAGFQKEWNGCRAPGVTEADKRDLDDVGMAVDLIDRFERDHGIDRSRVYAAGFSNGGSMAYRLATDAPERFAAIAAISAQVPEPENSKCTNPKGKISVLIMNGTADPIVPWEGGEASLFGISSRGRVQSTHHSVAHWLDVNGIVGDSEVFRFPDRDPADGSNVVRSRWGRPDGDEVILYAIHGGAHTVPGGPELGSRWLTARYVGYTNQDVDAPDEIWAFFRRHRN
jgi:polyhydroxybutyrate depolymerase